MTSGSAPHLSRGPQSILDGMRQRARVLSAFRQRAAAPLVGVFELEESGASLYLRAGSGWSKPETGELRLSAAPTSLGGHALSPIGAVIVESLALHPQFLEPILSGHGVTSLLAVGIYGQVDLWGVLGIFSHVRRLWSPDDLELARGLSGTIAAALYRERWARGQIPRALRGAPYPEDWESCGERWAMPASPARLAPSSSRPRRRNNPSRSVRGCGGQPGTQRSTGRSAGTPFSTSGLPRKGPPLMAHAPTAMTSRGSGVAS